MADGEWPLCPVGGVEGGGAGGGEPRARGIGRVNSWPQAALGRDGRAGGPPRSELPVPHLPQLPTRHRRAGRVGAES